MRSFNPAWAVSRNERPNPIALRLRSPLLLLVLDAGVLVNHDTLGTDHRRGRLRCDRERWAWHRRDPTHHPRQRRALYGRLSRAHGQRGAHGKVLGLLATVHAL